MSNKNMHKPLDNFFCLFITAAFMYLGLNIIDGGGMGSMHQGRIDNFGEHKYVVGLIFFGIGLYLFIPCLKRILKK